MPDFQPDIVIVSNYTDLSGGEAIRALQFFERLADARNGVWLVTHERSRRDLLEHRHLDRIRFVVDGRLQHWLWRFGLGGMNTLVFHWRTRALIRTLVPPERGHIVHYVCPISPIAPRFPPAGYRLIIGPLNGNIAYPDAFATREGRAARLRHRLHFLIQRLLRLTGEKQRYDCVLVSGHARTRASLVAAGVDPARMIDVADVGLPEHWRDVPRIRHKGANGRFVTASRLVDLKGIDLAIRAVAAASPDVGLDIFGEGEARRGWEQLAASLDLGQRVRFLGWCAHEDLPMRFRTYRGFVFPTLAEANGNVMQEAMMVGLPVIALRWGGPGQLADDASAIYVEPGNEARIIADIATAMTRLTRSPGEADCLAVRARAIAEERYLWDRVLASWTAHYDNHFAGNNPDSQRKR